MDSIAQNTLKNLDASIEQMNKKENLTSSDLEMLCKAYKLKMEIEGAYGEGGYSEGYTPQRDRSMGDWHAEGSFSPMRSPVTGRYVSRHSIKDRMIARLEEMYDEAEGPYEREEIRKEIRQLEANK